MRRLLNMLPQLSGHYGYESFNTGFRRIGYSPILKFRPEPGDALVIWNRYGMSGAAADNFNKMGAQVIVVENGYFGKHWNGSQWYAMALDHHNGRGRWPSLGGERWARWGVPLAPWRADGGETLVLGQRGIGELGSKSPSDWHRTAAKLAPNTRIRLHPGKAAEAAKAKPLEDDLKDTSTVFTWASSAALRALALGVPAFYGFPQWIGREAARPLTSLNLGRLTDDAARLAMFEHMSWAMWNRDEVVSGEALTTLLEKSS